MNILPRISICAWLTVYRFEIPTCTNLPNVSGKAKQTKITMDNYRRLKDFPTYIDEGFYDLIDDIEIQRTIIREVIKDILHQNKNSLLTVGILNRQLECSGASMFLASRNFFRDSATLILTLMELRLDLEYIVKSVDNKLKWGFRGHHT